MKPCFQHHCISLTELQATLMWCNQWKRVFFRHMLPTCMKRDGRQEDKNISLCPSHWMSFLTAASQQQISIYLFFNSSHWFISLIVFSLFVLHLSILCVASLYHRLCGHWMAADYCFCAAGDQSTPFVAAHKGPRCHSIQAAMTRARGMKTPTIHINTHTTPTLSCVWVLHVASYTMSLLYGLYRIFVLLMHGLISHWCHSKCNAI